MIQIASLSDRDPDEGEPARELEQWDAQEEAHGHDEGDAEAHRPHGAPDPAEELLVWRQLAHGERDHERVVAGEGDVDQNDAEKARPKLGVHEDRHVGLLEVWRRESHQPIVVSMAASASGSGYSST